MQVMLFNINKLAARLLRGAWPVPGCDCQGIGAEYPSPEKVHLSLRLPQGSWPFWGRVRALGAKVWDPTTRVQEP